MKRCHIFLLPLFFCFLGSSLIREARAEFFGSVPTGLLSLEKRYPCYLYVPPDYSPEKTWAFLVLVGQSGKDPKEVIQPWIDWGKEKHFLILVPDLSPREGYVPSPVDDWLKEVKREISQRYRIDPAQVLLAGIGSGAHYAAYLGMNYPEEFSAAVLVRGAWAGPFEKMIRPKSDARRQIPFYLALDPKAKEFSKSEAWALKLEKKGYKITLDPLKLEENFAEFQNRMAQWFREDTEARTLLRKKPRVKTKEKVGGFLKDFFAME